MVCAKSGILVVALTVVFCVAAAADDEAAKGQKAGAVDMTSLTEGQRLQLTVDSLTTLNLAIGAVAKEAQRRSELLDKYLREKGLAEAYLKAQPEMPDRAPKVADWTKKEKSDIEVPLTFDDALALAMECEMEDRGDEIRKSEPKDVEDLMRQEKAHRELARKRFGETLPLMIEVDRRVDFLRAQGQFEKAVVWAKCEIERQKAEKEKKAAEDKAAGEAEKKEKRQEQVDRREEARQKRVENVEQRWQKQVEAYQLQTERVKAKTGTSYPWNWQYRPW